MINETASIIAKEVKKEPNEVDIKLIHENNDMERNIFIKSEELYELDEIKDESCVMPLSEPFTTTELALSNKYPDDVTVGAANIGDLELLCKSRVKVPMYKCAICSYQGMRKKYLRQHMLCHSKVKMFECEKCPYQSQYKNNLIRHTLTHKASDSDDEDVEWYNCEICPFKTKYKRNIKSHMVCHLDIAMLECDICAYKTKRRTSLTQHKLTHKSTSEVPMYACETCSYQTRYKVTMELHILSHQKSSDNNMYECDLCLYKGKSKQDLRHHMLSHKRLPHVTSFRRIQGGSQLTNTS